MSYNINGEFFYRGSYPWVEEYKQKLLKVFRLSDEILVMFDLALELNYEIFYNIELYSYIDNCYKINFKFNQLSPNRLEEFIEKVQGFAIPLYGHGYYKQIEYSTQPLKPKLLYIEIKKEINES